MTRPPILRNFMLIRHKGHFYLVPRHQPWSLPQ